MARPEERAPPEVYYDADEAKKYTTNTRMMQVQEEMAKRCLELLALDQGPKLLLDLGCGSCLSMESLTEEGHAVVGADISGDMLQMGRERGLDGGGAILGDIGQGIPVRGEVFDGAISVSACQWLCNADSARADPKKRLANLFGDLYRALKPGARAALQFYPASQEQANMIASSAMRAGFSGGVVVDFPNSAKAKKHFLVVTAGAPRVPASLASSASGSEHSKVPVGAREPASKHKRKGNGDSRRSKARLFQLKHRHAQRGKEIPRDSRYSGRKRRRRPV